MRKMDEVIIVAPRKELFENEGLVFQGIESDASKIERLVKNINENMATMRRGDAEENPDFKQPIPYAVLRKGDKVFAYKRLIEGGEKRLHDKLSIGVGGHMNAIDGLNFLESTIENLKRELDEELYISDSDLNIDIIGMINDDINDVGKVHLGLLSVIDLTEDAEVSVKEIDQLEGFWLTKEDLKDQELLESLEEWSKYVAVIINKD